MGDNGSSGAIHLEIEMEILWVGLKLRWKSQNITKNVGTILADPTQINQVLINVCTNAHHAMPDGGIIEVILKNTEFDEDTMTQYFDLKPE